jgi:outer membrane protein
MRVLKSSILAAALMAALPVASFAQATPPATPPAAPRPQTPPATPPAGQTPAAPAAAPKPVVPFPADSKIAFIDVNAVAQNSTVGKDAAKKLAEIGEKNKQLTAMTTRRDSGTGVLNDTARATLDKDIEKLQRDIQFAQQNAQAEYTDLQNELQGEFQKRLIPVIDEVAKEKGLYAIYSIADSGAAYVHPGLDLSAEITKRLDAKK